MKRVYSKAYKLNCKEYAFMNIFFVKFFAKQAALAVCFDHLGGKKINDKVVNYMLRLFWLFVTILPMIAVVLITVILHIYHHCIFIASVYKLAAHFELVVRI